MQRRRPFTRLLGWLAAFALALQVGVPVAAAEQLAACCCKHKDSELCRCPICEHQRELEQNIPCMKTCGHSTQTAIPMPFVAIEPPVASRTIPLPVPDPVETPVPDRPVSPVREVPTPPPLA
jgi:hypothetical protein